MRSQISLLKQVQKPISTRGGEMQAQDVTRRTFLRMLAGLAFTGIGSGFVACSPERKPVSSSVSKPLQGKKLFTYNGHSSFVFAVAWSPFGLRIASVGEDQTLQVWEALSGSLDSKYTYDSLITSVAWSPDEKWIATGGDDQQVFIRDASNLKMASQPLKTHGGIWGLQWSPKGRYLAVGSSDVQIWDSQSKQSLQPYRGHKGQVWSLSWSPDGNSIASSSQDGTVQVWSAFDQAKWNHPVTFSRHKARVHGVAWSPDGNYIASVGDDRHIFVWKPHDASCVFEGSHADIVYAVSWSPNGQYIASSSRDRTVKVWALNGGTDCQEARNVAIYDGHSGEVYCTTWSPESKRLASAYRDATIQLWELPEQLFK